MTQGKWQLQDLTGSPVLRGSEIVANDGQRFVLRGGRPPQHAASAGKVWVVRPADPRDSMVSELYPSVFQLRWVEVQDG